MYFQALGVVFISATLLTATPLSPSYSHPRADKFISTRDYATSMGNVKLASRFAEGLDYLHLLLSRAHHGQLHVRQDDDDDFGGDSSTDPSGSDGFDPDPDEECDSTIDNCGQDSSVPPEGQGNCGSFGPFENDCPDLSDPPGPADEDDDDDDEPNPPNFPSSSGGGGSGGQGGSGSVSPTTTSSPRSSTPTSVSSNNNTSTSGAGRARIPFQAVTKAVIVLQIVVILAS